MKKQIVAAGAFLVFALGALPSLAACPCRFQPYSCPCPSVNSCCPAAPLASPCCPIAKPCCPKIILKPCCPAPCAETCPCPAAPVETPCETKDICD